MDGGVENSQIKNNPEKENVRKAFFALGIEFAILFVVLCAVLVFFNYFGILSLSKMYPNLFGFLPSKEKALTSGEKIIRGLPEKQGLSDKDRVPKMSYPTAIPNATGDFEVSSVHPSHNLSLSNEEELVKDISSWSVFGRYYANSAQGQTTSPLKKIKVILTDMLQPENQYSFDESGKISTSSKLTMDTDTITILLYISEAFIASTNKTQAQKDNITALQVLTRLYRATHEKTEANSSAFDKDMTKEISTILQKGTFFSVVKK